MNHITEIRNENAIFFRGLIRDCWENRDENDLFVGLVDENDKAVSACCFIVETTFATLKFIATDPAERRKGYAAELLTGAIRAMEHLGLVFATCYTYEDQDEQKEDPSEEALRSLLLKCGFEREELDIQRSVYRLKDMEGLFSKMGETEISGTIKSASELSLQEEESLYGIEEKYEANPFYLNIDKFLRGPDQYSAFLTENDEVVALTHGCRIGEGVLLDVIYGPERGLTVLNSLYRRIYEQVKELFSQDAPVYIDTYGHKLLEYQERLVGKAGEEVLRGIVYRHRI